MEDMKTYILDCHDGIRKRITVPADWKVTFGPAFVHGQKQYNNEGRAIIPMALRFYEKGDSQRAIFTDVVSFRDSSILFEVEETKVQEKEGFVECDGVRKHTIFRAAQTEWKNPDGAESQFNRPLLPKDEDMFTITE